MMRNFTLKKQELLNCLTHKCYATIATMLSIICLSFATQAQTNNALDFDGTDDFVTLPGSSLDPLISNNHITVEGWFYITETKNGVMLVGEGYLGDGNIQYCIYQDGGDEVNQNLQAGFFNGNWHTVSASIPLNTWVHLASTYDQASVKFYVNGTLTASAPCTDALPISTEEWRLGRRWDDVVNSNNVYNGQMDNVKIWNVVLSQADINANMHKKPAINQLGLVAHYDFDQGIPSGDNTTITSLIDGSGNSIHGTLNNFGLTSATSNFIASPVSIAGTAAFTFEAPSITGISPAFSNCLGSTGYLQVKASGNFLITYQWYKDGGLLANETLSGLALSNISALSAGNYSVVVSNIIGSVTSSGVALSISANCNNALDFDGNDDFVQLPEATYFTNNNFTVEAWVYPKAYNSWSRIIDFSNGASADNVLFAVSAGNSGKPNLGIIDQDGNGGNWTFNSQLSLNTWSHVAMVVNGNKASMYINGVLDASFTGVYDVSNVTRTLNYIGKSAWNSDDYASMILDELKIWNVGLTGSDIAANMNKKPALNQTGLLVYYDFDQGVQSGDNTTLTGLIDKSGNGYVGTLTGFTLNGGASNFISGAASLTSLTGTYAFLPYITISGNNNNINKTYGDPMFTISGFGSTSTAPFTYSVFSGTSVGINGSSSNSVDLKITGVQNSVLRISQAAAGGFAAGYTDVNIHVDQAYLNATAFDFSKIYGLPDAFTGTVTGMVYEDVFSVSYYLEDNQVVPSLTGSALGNYYVNYNYGTYFSTSLTSGMIEQIEAYSPTSIAAGDLNGDGFKDLVVTFQESNNILVYTNTGTGSFNEAGSYTTGYSPQSVVIVDLNGDGFPDLAVANQYSEDEGNNRLAGPSDHSVSVFTNTGTGSFGTKVDYAVGGSNPQSIAIGDVNGDGFLDLATANAGSGNVSVITNTGLGDFGVPINYPVGNNPYNVAFGDLNDDSKLDLVVTNYGSATISVLTNTGSGSFAAHVTYNTGSNPRGVAIGDLNGDGFPDMAVVNSRNNSINGNSVSVFTNTGTGSFSTMATYATGSQPFSVAIDDVNGDGKPDLAVTNYNDYTVSVLTNTGTGNFVNQITYNTGANPICIVLADLNGDSKSDIATANAGDNSISIILSTATGFSPKKDIYASVSYDYLAISDLNGDGKKDLVVVNGDNNLVSVKIGLGNNTYAKDVRYETGENPSFVVVGDLNGDSYPDLVISNNNDNTISVLTNTGSGSFGDQVTYATGSCPYGSAIGDINGDGLNDIAVTNNCDNNISVLSGTGTGSFGAKVDYTTGYEPISVALSDLNGDGLTDLAVANNDDNTVSVLTNTGLGSFGNQITYNTGYEPYSIAIGDLNNDGHPDLVTANYDDGNVSVLTNTGTGSFGNQVTYNTGDSPQSVVIGDFNGDGKPDLVVANRYDVSVSVLNNSGTGGFEEQTKFYLNNAYNAAIGDLDNDGRLDIAGATGNSIFTLLNNTLRAQSITGFNLPDSLAINASPLLFSAVATSGLPVSYASANNNVISVTGASGSPVSLGVVTLTAYQVGGGYYLPTAAIAIVTVHDTLTQQPQPTVTGISLEESLASVVIYPNPSSGKFFVKGAGITSVVVYDLVGNLITKTEGTTFFISAGGLYIAEVETAKGKKRFKLIVE